MLLDKMIKSRNYKYIIMNILMLTKKDASSFRDSHNKCKVAM